MIIALSSSLTFAQDGEGLFKAKCSACHMLGKDATGPDLNGVKLKWEEAGESEMLYRWIQDPGALVESGDSKLAREVEKYSDAAMTPQDVTNEEVDAILDYVDNYVAPVEPPVTTADTGNEVNIVYVPNYDKNLTIFYFLLFAILVQLIAILILSNSSRTFVKLQNYKIKKAAEKTGKTLLILLGVFAAMTANNSSLALEFMEPGAAESGPWLLVEDADLYVLIAVNIAMLLLVLHFRRLFLDIAAMVRPQTAATKKMSKRKQRKMNEVLTAAVPIEEEHTILLHHEYDGIKELDNNLPPWWVWGFYATIVFAVIYIFNYHVFKTGDLQMAEYDKSMEEAKIEVAEYLDKMAMNVDETNVTLLVDGSDLSTGKTLFETNCISCHNIDGGGNQIGPNLTDKAWIYGFDITEVFSSIKYGRANGMPAHNTKLNPIQLQQVASFVLSLPEVKGREPQGEIIEE